VWGAGAGRGDGAAAGRHAQVPALPRSARRHTGRTTPQPALAAAVAQCCSLLTGVGSGRAVELLRAHRLLRIVSHPAAANTVALPPIPDPDD
jgi:hypothetical protein